MSEPTPDGEGRLLLEVILPRNRKSRFDDERWWVLSLGKAALEVYDELCVVGYASGSVRKVLIDLADDMLDTHPPRYLQYFIDPTPGTAKFRCVALVDEFHRDLAERAELALAEMSHREEQAV